MPTNLFHVGGALPFGSHAEIALYACECPLIFFMWGLLFHSVLMRRLRFTRASAHEFDYVEVFAMEQYTAAFVAAWRGFKLRVSVS